MRPLRWNFNGGHSFLLFSPCVCVISRLNRSRSQSIAFCSTAAESMAIVDIISPRRMPSTSPIVINRCTLHGYSGDTGVLCARCTRYDLRYLRYICVHVSPWRVMPKSRT